MLISLVYGARFRLYCLEFCLTYVGFIMMCVGVGTGGGGVPLNIGKCCMCPTQKCAYTAGTKTVHLELLF